MWSTGLLFSLGITYLAKVQAAATQTDTHAHAAVHILSIVAFACTLTRVNCLSNAMRD